jgi:hypothetical protein
MNISRLLRSVLGDLQAAEPKTLELKVGQVVKGVVLQLLSEQDALVNIGGVQVRARLETPLQQGDVTMLQVQPESAKGQVTLKPLQSSNVLIADDSLGFLLKELGLKDQPAMRHLVQLLHQSGVPLSKETVRQFAQIQSQLPEEVPPDEWSQAAAVAFHKGIPLTRETVQAVRQALFGQPIHETLNKLSEQVEGLLRSGHVSEWPANTKDALLKIHQQLNAVRAASLQLTSNVEAGPHEEALPFTAQNRETKNAAPATASVRQALEPASSTFSEPADYKTSASVRPLPASSAQVSTAGPQVASSSTADQPGLNGLNNSMKQALSIESMQVPQRDVHDAATGAAGSGPKESGSGNGNVASIPPERQPPSFIRQPVLSAYSVQTGPAQEQQTDASPKNHLGQNSQDVQHHSSAATSSTAQDSMSKQGFDTDNGNWIMRLLKTMGVEHEHRIAGLLDKNNPEAFARLGDPASPLLSQGPMASDSSPNEAKAADTLKGLLLQLASSEDIPPAVRETVQQAVQHITGQQLMLSNDRAAMFTHLTLFVPILGQNGQQTAAIHIQSRKGQRGGLDADNCRLLFDLRMKEMGDTLVDVHVVDRIVSLHIHNDHPIVAKLLEASRDEIASSMEKIGYQFISLKCSAYPKKLSEAQDRSDSSAFDSSMNQHVKFLYSPKTYKGVDIRV